MNPLKHTALALTDAEVDALDPMVSLPNEQWNQLTKTQAMSIIHKRKNHLKNRQRPTSNKPDPDTDHDHDTPDTEFCTKCDKLTDHKQADCPNK